MSSKTRKQNTRPLDKRRAIPAHRQENQNDSPQQAGNGFHETTSPDSVSTPPPAQPESGVDEVHPYDETLLDVCRTRWQFADWSRLATIDMEHLLHHPQRTKLALLIATAHWQLGQTHQAQRFMQCALDWGASQRQVAQLLASGVHHCLAAAHAIMQNTEAARTHCQHALRTGGVAGDVELLASARLQRMQNGKEGNQP